MSKLTWSEVLADTTLNNLIKRINRRYLFMSEEDLHWFASEYMETYRIMRSKEKAKKGKL